MLVGDTDELEAAFVLIEHLIRDGDSYVSELGVIGYLGGFHMGTGTSRGLDPEVVRPWLGRCRFATGTQSSSSGIRAPRSPTSSQLTAALTKRSAKVNSSPPTD